MSGNCGTCFHWRRPEQREGFGNVVAYEGDEWRDDDDRWDAMGYVRGDADDRLYGECVKINLGSDLPLSEPAPLAVTRDASDYCANLYTQAEFGCALWTEIAATAAADAGGHVQADGEGKA